MVGYMNEEALQATESSGRVTFFSRSKNRLWTKGETSGHYLQVVSIHPDCDGDTLLVYAHPTGPTCHLGDDTCFQEVNEPGLAFLAQLEQIILERKSGADPGSYTRRLLDSGTPKVAQKVGEEAVELVIEALQQNDDQFIEEAADLMYHLIVLLADRGIPLARIANQLASRHTQKAESK